MKMQSLQYLVLMFAFTICSNAEKVTIGIGEKQGLIIPLYGVNAGPVMDTRDGRRFDYTQQYRSIGVKQVRTHDYYGYLDMSTLYPDQNADPLNPSSYNFQESDSIFRAILDGGFEPYLRIGDSWNAGPGFPVPKRRAPVNKKNWIKAVVEVVRHYKQIAGPRLRYVEIWNEPDHRQFWDSSQQEFNNLFDETAKVLKTQFPELKVGGPGFTAAAFLLPKNRYLVSSFLDYLRKHNTPIDFLSWHLYSNDPKEFIEAARFYRKLLDEYGFQKAESHLTECNTDMHRIPSVIKPFELRMGSYGAAMLTAAWIALQNERVDAVFFYRGIDASMDQPLFYGLLRANGAPKRSGLAFSLWSRLANCERLTVKNIGDPQSCLWLIAGRHHSGNILLLISNFSGQGINYEVLLDKKMVSGLKIEEISDITETIKEIRTNTSQVFIPGYSVHLLTLQPEK